MKIKDIKEKFWKVWYCLEKMFEFAGYDVSDEQLFSEEKNWHRNAIYFDKYERTDKQQNEFENWLYTQLWNSKEWRKWIMRIPIKKKKIIDKTVSQFILAYGLKLKK